MRPWHPFVDSIRLHVPERVSLEDARRQERTAREILERLARQPGLVLADEVGMGKTFVALAVAASVALSDKQRRPAVVMVPPSLREKWPRDFDVFRRECLPPALARRLTAATAERGVDFLKLLDDPPARRKSIIFLAHGALHRGLGRGVAGGWMKLALIQRALHRRKNLGWLKQVLHRRLGEVLEMGSIHRRHPEVWEDLLKVPCSHWLGVLREQGIDPQGDDDRSTNDDPIPVAVVRVLDRFDGARLENVLQALHAIPVRDSANYPERLADARQTLNDALADLWRECLGNLHLRLPLLILDEAHHLKNAQTRLASLFQVPDAAEDAAAIAVRGPLGGVFERMLFLTATPFQLGHHELCSVLDRFDGICWREPHAPRMGRETFRKQMEDLRKRLDAAQEAALCFDVAWGKLTPADLVVGNERFDDVETWWSKVQRAAPASPTVANVLDCHRRVEKALRAAEEVLKPWVIRHHRTRELTGRFAGRPRRQRLPGRSILNDDGQSTEAGIEISEQALLPFLLAARATACMAESRPIFAEGLASSYEAFRYTREHNAGLDADSAPPEAVRITQAAGWYLAQLERALPLRGPCASFEHPKVRATAERALRAWQRGEKVLVFCHFIQTGRALRRVISTRLHETLLREAAKKLRCSTRQAERRLRLLSRRFFDLHSPVRMASEKEISELLRGYPKLKRQAATLREIMRRYLRTPAFLVRYVPLGRGDMKARAIQRAFGSEPGLRAVFGAFLDFLERHCTPKERDDYLTAVRHLQTGELTGRAARQSFEADELAGCKRGEVLLPNVRLVNGQTKPETRQRLMLAFNSPFFPEILITSNVLAEGVDLHRCCRVVIHHDLDWNPSVVEQRTGRVDRIGAKVEWAADGQPICVYLPYVAETQDEKMYRVVMDRERWFNVVMGEQFHVDARTTDKLARRVPLPESIARNLAFRLDLSARSVHPTGAPARDKGKLIIRPHSRAPNL